MQRDLDNESLNNESLNITQQILGKIEEMKLSILMLQYSISKGTLNDDAYETEGVEGTGPDQLTDHTRKMNDLFPSVHHQNLTKGTTYETDN